MADDTTKDESGDFDEWLEEQPGPPTDPTNPYQDLISDDADEIAEWMAFTGGAPGSTPDPQSEAPPPPPESEPVDEPVGATGEIDVVVAPAASDDDAAPTAPDGEDLQSFAPLPSDDEDLQNAETVEIDAVVADGHGIDESAHVAMDEGAVVDSDVDAVMGGAAGVASTTPTTATDPEDTGEIEVVPIAPYGGYTSDADPIPPESRELFDLSSSDYVATGTTEHSDLAEAVAAASAQDTEQVPIAASIPGMTDTVVGFEDVVAAEGMGRVRARASGDLVARVITALVLVAALGASLIWQPVLALFALTVFVLGASEFYTSLVRADYKPIGIFGFIGIIGASVGAYFWGPLAIPMAFIIAVALLLLYYAVVPGKSDPLGNLALTITVMVWVGLGAYTMLIVVSDWYRPLVIGVVVIVAAMDIGQYFVGRAIGRTPLSPWVSPKKTIEGLAAGVIIALAIGALLHFVEPFELTSGLALGLAVAILAPLGDLAMSAAKRSLGLKDMGSVLPGHGGFLDRIDGLLFVIPAAWVVFLWAGIL
jgi:phosphatidate cytidylyltransferase